MKKFKEFLTEEIKLRGNKGLPDNFISNTDAKASRELGVNIDDVRQARQFGEPLMRLIRKSGELITSGLSKSQIEDRIIKLQDLAKSVILSEYGSILDNVDLEINLVGFGEIANELPEIADVEEKPASRRQQEEEMEKYEEEEEPKEEEDDKEKSFLDKLFGDDSKSTKDDSNLLDSPLIKNKIDKAKILNNIIQGEAKNTKHILHTDIVKTGLSEIFGNKADEIFKVWDDITKAADKLDWVIPIQDKASMMKQNMGGMAGAVKVEWPEMEDKNEEDQEEGPDSENLNPNKSAEDILKSIEEGEDIEDNEEEISELFSNGNPKIKSYGVDFPMLLHETVKGIYELIAAAAIPDDKKVAKIVKMNVSSFEDEAEDFRYGPYIASALRDFINSCPDYNKYPNIREHVFGKMLLISDEEFLSLMKGILDKTPKAKSIISGMITDVISELKEYDISQIDSGDDVRDYSGEDREEEEPMVDDEIEKLIKGTKDAEENIDVDYSKLRKSEIQELVDKAIDSRDFETLKKLEPFIKESFIWKMYESEINKILK